MESCVDVPAIALHLTAELQVKMNSSALPSAQELTSVFTGN